MKILPFLGLAGSAAAVLAERRGIAPGLWSIALAATLGLFAAHATSALNLSFEAYRPP